MFVEKFDEEKVEFLRVSFIWRHEVGVETDDKHRFMSDPKDSQVLDVIQSSIYRHVQVMGILDIYLFELLPELLVFLTLLNDISMRVDLHAEGLFEKVHRLTNQQSINIVPRHTPQPLQLTYVYPIIVHLTNPNKYTHLSLNPPSLQPNLIVVYYVYDLLIQSFGIKGQTMSIYDTWNIYKDKMEEYIVKFNQANKDGDFPAMTIAKDNTKKVYIKFLDLLKLEHESTKEAFREQLDAFLAEIKKMSEFIKNNEGKKILNNETKDEKTEIKNNLEGVIVRQKPTVTWDDVAGLAKAKQALKEAVIMPLRFPEIFKGNRKPWKGILLYGPPGTGKTFIAKACAHEMPQSTFFSVSSSDIMSKYVGQSEKIVKALFQMARKEKSSIIFIDEVDSMTGNRSEGENQSSKRVKTQFLVQMDGVGHDSGKLLVLGATNLPWELDPAIRRRFQRRIYIPLPEYETRYSLLKRLITKTPNTLTDEQIRDLAQRSEGYSGSDISTLVKDAVYEPLRISQKAKKFRKTKNEKGQDAWLPVPPSEKLQGAQYFEGKLTDLQGKLVLPDLEYKHFITSLVKVKPSVDHSQLTHYKQFTQQFGQDG